MGREILFCPIWGDVRGAESWKLTARSRAMDNSVYFVTSIFDGHSLIVNPAGMFFRRVGTQGTLITATVDLNYNPPWDWLGNAGRGVWRDVWRKDCRIRYLWDSGELHHFPCFNFSSNHRRSEAIILKLSSWARKLS